MQERIACQRAIEAVYWEHTDWPRGENTPKPSLGEVMKESIIRQRAEDAVRMSHLLDEFWGRPIGAAELQAELDRLVANTKNPAMLGEFFAALGDDPDLIAECLARPIVARRTALELYADDERLHGALRAHAEKQLAALGSAAELPSLDGEYFELEARRDDGWGSRAKRDGTPGEDNVAWLDPPTWAEHLERVAEATGHAAPGRHGPLLEDAEKLRVVVLLDQDEGYTKVASVTWFKRDFADWWREHRSSYPASGIERVSGLRLAPLKSGSKVLAEGWSDMPITAGTPSARHNHTVVWTGTLLIVWGGTDGMGVYYNGATFHPVTDIWWPITNTGAPGGRMDHTAVWTGTHMIVYGGYDGTCLNDGGRYDRANDNWSSLNTNNTLSGRRYHQAVWSPDAGKMYVWGGTNGSSYFGNGAYFNPDTNIWGAMSSNSDPSARARHTMTLIEDASEEYLVVWGGSSASTMFGNGSVYSIEDGNWQSMSTSNDPTPREGHTAVFLGAPYNGGLRLGIWGGYNGTNALMTGGLYDFPNDEWSYITPSGAPGSRQRHTAVGGHYRMLVWGGYSSGSTNYSSGGVYNHINNDWEPMATSTLSGRRLHAAEIRYATTNSFRMMVWGGYDSDETDTGAEYRPMDDFAVYCSVDEVGGVPGGSYNPPGYCNKVAFEAFDESVTLSCDGLPVAGCSFSNNPSTPQYSSAITGVSVSAGTSTGTYDFWVRGTSDGKTRSWPMRVKVMDYDIVCSPSPLYVAQGDSTQMNCTISSENAFNDQVSVEVTTNGYFDASPATRYVTPPPNGTAQTSFTISPKAGTPAGGPYQLEIGAFIAGTARLDYLNVYVNPAATDEIFSDGFELGDLSAWN
jgi:hypothetical protein